MFCFCSFTVAIPKALSSGGYPQTHTSLRTTRRYLHWVPGSGSPGGRARDLLATLGEVHDA